jgi:hypothetical protein
MLRELFKYFGYLSLLDMKFTSIFPVFILSFHYLSKLVFKAEVSNILYNPVSHFFLLCLVFSMSGLNLFMKHLVLKTVYYVTLKSYRVLHFVFKSMIYFLLIFVQGIRINLRHGCFINKGQITQESREFKSM